MLSCQRRRFLVTGAQGCVGAWTVLHLLEGGADRVVALDVGEDRHRLRLLLGDERPERLVEVRGDVRDVDALERTLAEHEVGHVVHLAALQVPACRTRPELGAAVNVAGTVNVLEAVRRRGGAHLVYASSIAAYDAGVQPSMRALPGTMYGVFKRACEGAAALFHADHGVSSIGLRPHTVYGPGRDQGITSAPTSAMVAAVAGRPYEIPFSGRVQMQHASDVAVVCVRAALLDGYEGATVHDLGGPVASMAEVVGLIERARPEARGLIRVSGGALPFPERLDGTPLRELVGADGGRPLADGVAAALDQLAELVRTGRLDPGGAPA